GDGRTRMTPDDLGPREDEFSELLAAYDESLAGGDAPAPTVPADLEPRLRGAQACLHALERLWPRSLSSRPPGSCPPDGAPHVVPVYEAGEVGPVCYIASAFCDGPTLAAWLRSRMAPVPPKVAAAIVTDLADAVGYAHGRGFLHRDLKPGNILLFPVPPRKGD